MSNLILDSLEIRNFRGLKELKIEKLGRVNLLVGKNNSGKTSVLEALRLYCEPGSPDLLLDILERRSEIDLSSRSPIEVRSVQGVPIRSLFHGRKAVPDESDPILIGPADSDAEQLSIRLMLLQLPRKPSALAEAMRLEEPAPISEGLLCLEYDSSSRITYTPVNNLASLLQYRDTYFPRVIHKPESKKKRATALTFVDSYGLKPARLDQLWDAVALTAHEEDVVSAMTIIDPMVDRLNLKSTEGSSSARVPFVKLRGQDEPVPLGSLGDGPNRLFGIALALVNAQNGVFLIDEIENGLHYSIQPDVWKTIFRLASTLNVQVFATTHSFDCIQAFEEAARESEEEGVLIRIAQKGGKNLIAEFNEEEMGTIVEGRIEVR